MNRWPGFHRRSLLLLSAAMLLTAGACGDDDDDTTTQSGDPSVTTVADGEAATTATAAPTTPAASADEPSPPTGGSAGVETTTSSVGQPTGEPITIGVIIEETGPLAALGLPELQAIELATELANAAGGIDGRPIQLEVRDSESEPAIASAAAREFADRDDIAAVLGTATGASCAAVNAILEPEGIMQFCLSPIATEVTPLIFWAQGPLGEYGNFMLPWLEDQGISRIGLVRTADTTGDAMQGILDTVVAATSDSLNLEQTGSETFDSGATDVQTQLSNLRATDPELVVAGASGSNLLPIVQAMNALGMDVPLLVAHGSVVHSVLDLVQGQIVPGGMVAGLWWVNVPDDEIPDSVGYKDAIVEFKMAWEEKHATPTGHSEGAAFDSANQIFDALRAGAMTGGEIAAFIEGREDFVGVLGPYSYGPDDHQGPTYPIGMLEFGDDGQFHLNFLAE